MAKVGRFAAQPLGELGQGISLRIREPQPGGQLGAENAILGDQVLVAQQQFLVDESRHEGQQLCPMESIAHGRTLLITTSGRQRILRCDCTSIFPERAQCGQIPGNDGGFSQNLLTIAAIPAPQTQHSPPTPSMDAR